MPPESEISTTLVEAITLSSSSYCRGLSDAVIFNTPVTSVSVTPFRVAVETAAIVTGWPLVNVRSALDMGSFRIGPGARAINSPQCLPKYLAVINRPSDGWMPASE